MLSGSRRSGSANNSSLFGNQTLIELHFKSKITDTGSKILQNYAKNPVTDKIERNLEYAKVSIDTLDMLQARTKGNLTEYEEKFLTEALKDLKLNYVDEVEKDKAGSADKETPEEKKTTEENPPEEKSEE